MALLYPEAPCSVCGQPIGSEVNDIIAFDCIEVPQRDFQHFSDCLAHVSCLSNWERRDEFMVAWNDALSEYYRGKRLRVDGDGRVAYTDSATWVLELSPGVQQRHAEQWERLAQNSRRRREDLAERMDAARLKAIRLGLAGPRDVDRFIYELPLDQFLLHFEEFRVSRAFFKAPPR